MSWRLTERVPNYQDKPVRVAGFGMTNYNTGDGACYTEAFSPAYFRKCRRVNGQKCHMDENHPKYHSQIYNNFVTLVDVSF